MKKVLFNRRTQKSQ